MTQKCYIAFAELVKNLPKDSNSLQIERSDLIVELCKLFREDNPRFSSDRFIAACE